MSFFVLDIVASVRVPSVSGSRTVLLARDEVNGGAVLAVLEEERDRAVMWIFLRREERWGELAAHFVAYAAGEVLPDGSVSFPENADVRLRETLRVSPEDWRAIGGRTPAQSV